MHRRPESNGFFYHQLRFRRSPLPSLPLTVVFPTVDIVPVHQATDAGKQMPRAFCDFGAAGIVEALDPRWA